MKRITYPLEGPSARLMLSVSRLLREASPRSATGTVLSCIAGTGMISTALDDADALNVRAPPV